jgi:hypothetical protein
MTYTVINCAVGCVFLLLFCLAGGQRLTGYPYLDGCVFLLMALGTGAWPDMVY